MISGKISRFGLHVCVSKTYHWAQTPGVRLSFLGKISRFIAKMFAFRKPIFQYLSFMQRKKERKKQNKTKNKKKNHTKKEQKTKPISVALARFGVLVRDMYFSKSCHTLVPCCKHAACITERVSQDGSKSMTVLSTGLHNAAHPLITCAKICIYTPPPLPHPPASPSSGRTAGEGAGILSSENLFHSLLVPSFLSKNACFTNKNIWAPITSVCLSHPSSLLFLASEFWIWNNLWSRKSETDWEC